MSAYVASGQRYGGGGRKPKASVASATTNMTASRGKQRLAWRACVGGAAGYAWRVL